jgi:hypothetical protein
LGFAEFCAIELLLFFIFMRGNIKPRTNMIPNPIKHKPMNVKSLKAAPLEGLFFS